jgi:hypothetical protein
MKDAHSAESEVWRLCGTPIHGGEGEHALERWELKQIKYVPEVRNCVIVCCHSARVERTQTQNRGISGLTGPRDENLSCGVKNPGQNHLVAVTSEGARAMGMYMCTYHDLNDPPIAAAGKEVMPHLSGSN